MLPPDFAQFISRYLQGKVQKISVNAALSCPNRDGTKGRGGCSYCNNSSFSPDYALNALSVAEQISRGKAFFSRKYPQMRYLAYFQSYTSTNAPIEQVCKMYNEALVEKDVVGLIIGTRPDCMPQELLNRLKEIASKKFVMVEYGAESANDDTLQRVNRCHTWAETVDAVMRTHQAGLPVGLHLIMGLPGETKEDMLKTIDMVNELPVDMIKCHQMQLIKGTRLAADVAAGRCSVTEWSVDEYVDFCCEIIGRLRPGIGVERFVSQSPDDLLISPRWGLKNYEFTAKLWKRIIELNNQA